MPGSDGHREKLLAILELSRRMLLEAGNKEWEAVAALFAERGVLLLDFFSRPVASHDGAWTAEIIQDILSNDKLVIELAQTGHAQLGEQLNDLKRGKTVARAYAENSK